MIAVDTNIVVRYVVGDDPGEEALAAAVLESGEPIFLAHVVLCELVWVLGAAYGHARRDIAGTLRDLVESKEIVVERVDLVRRALERYARSGDFADHLILEVAREAGARHVVTFDRKLHRHDGFVRAGGAP